MTTAVLMERTLQTSSWAFVRLTNLPTYPLDRLSRYEAALWRQACQTLFALQMLERRKPWERGKFRAKADYDADR